MHPTLPNPYLNLCLFKNKKPLQVVKDVSVATGSITKWKTGSIPNGETLLKIADYFNCSVDYLLGRSEELCGNSLSEKEKRLVSNYRNKPEMQSAVDRLLGIEEILQPKLYTAQVAAFGGDMQEITYAEEELEALKEIKRKQNKKD